jgi:putative zinc finger protein
MPSDPRVSNEPSLEELSAFIDDELDADAHARVGAHVAGCQDCKARLDGLRQAAHAVRALPMETPQRTFTIPAQRRQSWRWAPVGWIGSAAVALLLVVVGIQNLHLPASSPTAGPTANYNAATSAHNSTGGSGAAPLAAPAASTPQFDSQARAAAANTSTTVDPSNGSRRMILGTDRASYSTSGRMTVTIQLSGSPSTSTNSGDQGLTLTLVRNGAGVALNPVGVISGNGTPVFGGTYDLSRLPLAGPGDYRLEATWVIPDGSGRVLQASVPIQIAG